MLQLLASIVIFCGLFLYQIQLQLDSKIQRVKADAQLDSGSWDLSAYNSDPQLIGTYPLYFIAVDGFVLDRRTQIHGFLDTSDFKRLLIFKTPQSVTSISNQTRRVYVKPILYQDNPIGVIAVSYFNPSVELLDQIDSRLITTANEIHEKISTTQGVIDIRNVDARAIPYEIAFNIIDSYNTILTKTTNVNSMNRIPNFIDPSYVKPLTSSAQKRFVRDAQKGEIFLLQSYPVESDSKPVAVIVIGQSLAPMLIVLKQFIIAQGGISALILCICAYILVFTKVYKSESRVQSQTPRQVFFNDKRGVLAIGGVDIEIPYATNQYYLLQMLFSNPARRLETDELLERFGVQVSASNSRKVYDAMISINKKVSKITPLKLILNQNKTYQLNPAILTSKP